MSSIKYRLFILYEDIYVRCLPTVLCPINTILASFSVLENPGTKTSRKPKLAKMAFIGQEKVRKQHTDITSAGMYT